MPYRPQGDGAVLETVTEIHDETIFTPLSFPEDTDETITFASAGGGNTFGAWAEIVDNNAVTLSSKFAANEGHITGIFIETANEVAGTIYLLEISWGDARTIVASKRFIAPGAAVKGALAQTTVGIGPDIDEGETIYYRMKDSVGGGTCTLGIVYMLYD